MNDNVFQPEKKRVKPEQFFVNVKGKIGKRPEAAQFAIQGIFYRIKAVVVNNVVKIVKIKWCKEKT